MNLVEPIVRKMSTQHGGLGWRPQLPDWKDHQFSPTVSYEVAGSKASYYLSVGDIPVLNQGQQGSCVGHGVSGLVMYDQKVQGEYVIVPSREFIYYNARVYEGTQDQDSGAEVRDGVKVVAKLGVPPDTIFPYNDQVFNVEPPPNVYQAATRQEALVYEAVRYGHIRQALASGFPVVFGFTVYQSFESEQVASNGIVPLPNVDEQPIGGHCVWAYGYNNATRMIRCRNSWGRDWGMGGDFDLPFDYFNRGLCSDFWVIRRISGGR